MDISPFPANFLGVDLYHSGGWQALGTDLDQSGVSLSHGVRSEGSTADVSDLKFKVTNSAGKYSPRNPASPLYGLVGRNTPVRARVELGAPWLNLEASGSRAEAPDSVANSITGDIDIRWWGVRDSWKVAADLMGKWNTMGNQRSWILRAEANGVLTLFWSADGTTILDAGSTAALPAWAGEIAIRATLDVNNGASGKTVTFYYSTDLTGTWVQLGEQVITAGTTSIYNSTAPLTIGKIPTSSGFNSPVRVHGWELRAGIGGALRSSRTTSALTKGATSFTDVEGATWTVTAGSVSNAHILASCEVAEWPVDWNTKGAPSVMTDVQASGVTRRLGQGAQPVESVLYRAISAVSDDVIAYWPLEDGRDAESFGAAIGKRTARFGSAVTPAAYDGFPGSAPLPTLSTSSIRGEVDKYTNTGEVQVRWVQWTPAAGVAGEYVLMRVEFTGGSIARVDLKLRADGETGVFGYDDDGTELGGSTFVLGANVENSARRFSLELNQSGSNVFWRKSTLEAGQTSGSTYGQNFSGSQTLGIVRKVSFARAGDDLGQIAVGHLSVGTAITPLFDGIEAEILTGHLGEAADDRMVRLAAENGSSGMTVRARATAALGEQQEETMLDLMAESAEADGGILHDDMRTFGLRFRSLRSMGGQPAVVIPYQDNLVIPFETTDDDGLTRNRVTVSRPNGTRITEEAPTGPMSVQAPPAGVGLYDESLTLNLLNDDLVSRTASWRLHIGTWDESRYPTLGVDLAHPYFLAQPVLTRRLLALTPGDRIVITDPPPWLPPRDVDVIVQGIAASITPHHLRLTWSCVPARPYRIGFWNAGHRWSGEGTVLTSSRNTTTTSLLLTTPTRVTWTHADGDYDIVVGGEVMTVTNVVGNTMTVIRSVNGVVKSHPAGAAVQLADPSFYTR